MNHGNHQNHEDLNDIRRHRQHGADIAADHRRGEALGRIVRSTPYLALMAITATGVYLAARGAASEEDHAPQPPAALASRLHQEQPPTKPPETP